MVSKTAGFAHALAKGAEGYATGAKDRDAAKVRKAEGQAKLDKMKHAKQTGAVNTEMDAITKQNKEITRVLQEQATFRSLDAYTADFDTRHLNAVKQHPMLKDKFKDLASIDKIDVFNDLNLLRRNGFEPARFTEEETKENASGRYLKATMANGEKRIVDMMTIYGGTGYTKHLNNQALADLVKRATISKNKGSGKQDTAMVRNAEATAAAEKRIKEAEAKGEQPAERDVQVVKFANTKKGGVKTGQIDAAATHTDNLVKKFGGRDKFFKTDFGERDNFLDAHHDVAAIEKLEGVTYSSKEKTDLANIRALIAMGDPGANLSDSDTGLIDTTFMKAKKFVSDEVGGVAARSAYAAFRNTVRHALFGSALTEAEIRSFQEAFGGLGQKLGPVLQQFKTALTQVKAKLGSIATMNNPYSAHVRLGVDVQKLDSIIAGIDERIEAMSELDLGNKPEVKDADLSGLGGAKE